jgi:hypothetical protein
MKHVLLRLACGLPCLALVTAAAYPPLFERGSDALVASLLADLPQEQEHTQRLDAEWDILNQRVGLTDEVRAALIAGRLTLLEAAEQVLAINADLPPHQRTPLPKCPGCSETERACRYLLTRVQMDLKQDSRAGEVLARLNGQLSGYLAGSQRQEPGYGSLSP